MSAMAGKLPFRTQISGLGMLRLVLAFCAAPLLLAAAQRIAVPTQSLAGRYFSQFQDGLVTGEKYTGEDIVEIVPVAPGAAYVRVHLDYYNGHTCGIHGIATAKADALVYSDSRPNLESAGGCTLTMRRAGKSLSVDDGGGSCSSYCGARGTLSGVDLPYKSKRPIRYLMRLKQSSAYRDALTEWRSRKSPAKN